MFPTVVKHGSVSVIFKFGFLSSSSILCSKKVSYFIFKFFSVDPNTHPPPGGLPPELEYVPRRSQVGVVVDPSGTAQGSMVRVQ